MSLIFMAVVVLIVIVLLVWIGDRIPSPFRYIVYGVCALILLAWLAQLMGVW